jgi:hypothetical protein
MDSTSRATSPKSTCDSGPGARSALTASEPTDSSASETRKGKPEFVNGYRIEAVERVEGKVYDLRGKFGGDLTLEAGNRHGQWRVFDGGDNAVGRGGNLHEIEKAVDFALALYDVSMEAGIDDDEPPF